MLTDESARQLVPELMKGRLTSYQWVKEFYKGLQAHVGEVMAIKAMRVRQKDQHDSWELPTRHKIEE